MSVCFRAQSAKKTRLRFATFNFSEKLQNIFEIGLKKYGVFVQKSLPLKKIFERNNLQTVFHVLIYPLSKFGGNRTNSYLPCPLQVKKWIRENSAKCVSQTGNFYFRPKLQTAISQPIFIFLNDFFFTLDISLGSLL